MKTLDAIKQADSLRDNTLPAEQKAAWLNKLDGEIAEMMGVDAPENAWPEDSELLMPREHDEVYVLYLVAMIDYYNQESTLYQNDMVVYNTAMSNARAWWRRHNCPERNGGWKVW